MRNKIIYFILFFIIFSFGLKAEIILKKTDEWKSDYLEHEWYRGSFINEKGDMIIMFKKDGIFRITKGKLKKVAREGQGPGEVLFVASLCKLYNGFADIENYKKIQVFEFDPINNRYDWKKNIWREEKLCEQFVSNSLFIDNKWILSGGVYSHENMRGEKEDILSPYFLRILNNKGKLIKQLVRLKFNKFIRNYLFDSFLSYDKDNIYLVIESMLKIYVINRKKMLLKKIIELHVPECYKKIPKGFYAFKRKREERRGIRFLYEEWKTNYSIITNFKLIKNYFVLEIRNFGKNRDKKFVLLFYDKKTLKLKKTFRTNDFLLDIKGNRFYFYKNGIPPYDDEADSLSINIYEFKER